MKTRWTQSPQTYITAQVQASHRNAHCSDFSVHFPPETFVSFTHKPASSFSNTAGLCWVICIDLLNKKPLAGSEAQTLWALKQIRMRQLRQAGAASCYKCFYDYSIGVYAYTHLWSENTQYLQSHWLKDILFCFALKLTFKNNFWHGDTIDQIYACIFI